MPTRPRSCNRKTTGERANMIRKLGLIAAVAGAALAAQADGAHAQYFSPDGLDRDILRCELWHPVSEDKAATQRRLFVVQLVPPPSLWSWNREVGVPGIYFSEGVSFKGMFVIPFKVPLALWSDPNGKDATTQFTTRRGTTIEFLTPEGAKSTFGAVISGSLTQRIEVKTALSSLPSIACTRPEVIAGDLSEPKPDAGRKSPSLAPRIESDVPRSELEGLRLGAVFDKYSKTPPAPAARPGAEGPPSEPGAKTEVKPVASHTDYGKSPPSMKDLFKSPAPAAPEPSAGKKVAEGELPAPGAATIPSPAASAPASTTPAEKPPTPAVASEPAPPAVAVCSAADLKPLTAPAGIDLKDKDRQPVGLRSSQTEFKASQYVNVGGPEVFPVDFTFDLTDSKDKLIPYEHGALTGAKLWVSFPGGLQWSDAKHKNDPPPKPAVALRIMVVGGPQEVAISGLDKVGAELKKSSKGGVTVDVYWHGIDASGALLPATHYDSFHALVTAAAAQATGPPAVLDEKQIKTFLNSFEEELKKQSTPVDKVFWVKGGYSIPSSIPERFEQFIKTVSASGALVRTPKGDAGKWLVVVTRWGSDFSFAYLKQPLLSQNAGDVVEEADSSKNGPLISDTKVWAERLKAAATRHLTPGAATVAPASAEAPSGTPVLDAAEVFTQRGYLLSSQTALLLREHLHDVEDLWLEAGAAAINLESVKAVAAKMSKSPSTLTLVDVLQDDNEGGLKLPKLLPDGSRKPLVNLTPAEGQAALQFVRKYLAGAKRAVDSFKRIEAARESSCTLLFVPDELFGFPTDHAARR